MDNTSSSEKQLAIARKSWLVSVIAQPIFIRANLLNIVYFSKLFPRWNTRQVSINAISNSNIHLEMWQRKELLVKARFSCFLIKRLLRLGDCTIENPNNLARVVLSRYVSDNDNPDLTCVETLEGHNECVEFVAFYPEHYLATSSRNDTIRKLCLFSHNRSTATCVVSIKEPSNNFIWSFAFHPTLPRIATGFMDGTLKLFSFSSNETQATCLETLKAHRGYIDSVNFHLTLPFLATCCDVSWDKTLKLWCFNHDVSTTTCVATLRDTTFLAFHPTDAILATNSYSYTIKLWRFSPNGTEATCVATLWGDEDCFYSRTVFPNRGGHTRDVSSAVFHPKLPLLATGSHDKTVKLWRISSDISVSVQTCEATLMGHTESVYSIAFHPRAPLLATGSCDNTVKLWRISSDGKEATCLATLIGHSGIVHSVRFHSTLPLLATGSRDKTVKLWR